MCNFKISIKPLLCVSSRYYFKLEKIAHEFIIFQKEGFSLTFRILILIIQIKKTWKNMLKLLTFHNFARRSSL